MQSRNNNNIKGIDVSHHNGNIDWDKVKATGLAQVVYMKATEGTSFVSNKLIENYNACKERGIPVGFYHYFNLDKDPKLQAEHFYNTIKDLNHRLLHVLDYEEKGKSAVENTTLALIFKDRLKELSGQDVLLYTGGYFARDLFTYGIESMQLWIAHYGVDTPLKQNRWNEWVGFQYTSRGAVDGINGDVDMNEFTSNIYVNTSAAPQPTPTPVEKKTWEHYTTDPISGEFQRGINSVYGTSLDTDCKLGELTFGAIKEHHVVIRAVQNNSLVKVIQKRLMQLGYSLPKYGADGKMSKGGETEKAVIKFQTDMALKVDGEVGINTIKELFKK